MFQFILFYMVGAVVFFCHVAIIIITSVGVFSSRMKLTESEGEQLFVSYFARILFQVVMMIIFPIAFLGYIKISDVASDVLFVSSGLFTVVWLVTTGVVIKYVYYLVTHKIEALKGFNYDIYFQSKEFLWIACPLLYGILFSLYDKKIFFYVLAMVLGKYLWMDSFQVISLSDIKMIIADFYKKFKIDILLLVCQAFVMGYLLVRWYPIRNGLMNIEYSVYTFLLLMLFLMPLIDLCIFDSMRLHVGLIKKQD